MEMQHGDSGAPEAGVVSSGERQEAMGGLSGRQEASQQLQTEQVTEQPPEGLVSFVAAAEYANNDYLVKAGTIVKAPLTAGSTPGMIPMVTREGDVWAKFVNGVLVTDDPQVIKWCDEHPKICRRSDDPMTKSWATLKELTTRKANREQLLDASEMNADESFPPRMLDGLREQAAKAGSPGSQVVESAESAKKNAEQERAAANPVT